MVEITAVHASAYTVPTDEPEGDGTISWQSTTLVLVEVVAEGQQGIGWTYNCAATADLVRDELASVVEGRDAMDVPAANLAMAHAVRNIGRPGVAACALSAIDIALWDLKARILEVPLHMLLGQVRE